MRQIDLTDKLQKVKGSRVSYSTVYLHSGRYTGFVSSVGVSFVRALKKGGIATHKNGTAKWYFGGSQSLSEALSTSRRRYGIKLPVKGWEKVRIKTYNTTMVDEIINTLTQ